MTAVGKQSFLHIIAACWVRPRLLVMELTWRWLCGGILLLLGGVEAHHIAIATQAQIQSTGLFNATLASTLQDPTQLSVALASTLAILRPWLTQAAWGLGPLVLFVWVAAFAFGRSALLQRYDPTLPGRAWLLATCEMARLLVLLAVSAFWYAALQWAARYALGPSSATPDAPGPQAEPHLVLYCALVLCITLGLFMLWSVLSWSLVAAPLVALVEKTSFSQGFLRALRMGRARGKLVEVNIAMGVIKLGLVVLAMVFSATPLPFEAVVQGWPLTAWWVFVTLVYFAASDFFKMARLFAFLEFWREHLRPTSIGLDGLRARAIADPSLRSG